MDTAKTDLEQRYETFTDRLSGLGCMWAEVWQSAEDDLWYVSWAYVAKVERDTNASIVEAVNDEQEGPFTSADDAMQKAIELNADLLAKELKSPGYGVYAPWND